MATTHRKNSAWGDDDDVEAKQSLHQKEVITKQMIGIISTRLESLQAVANNRKLGLECDLKVNSEYCSKKVPALQDPYDKGSTGSNKTKAVTIPTTVANQAMMERLFGPDEKSRQRTQVLKKNKAELQKSENRKNLRVQLEKQLQSSVEGHITRTVDSCVYSLDQENNSSLPQVNSRLLLLHTYERMRIIQGKKNFKKFLISEVSSSLFEETFWLCFCHFFQKDSIVRQKYLVEQISAKYVKTINSSMDYIARFYPYAVSSAVGSGFHYLFPGSRHLYSASFKNEIFLFVCQLLFGLKLCSTSVQAMRKQLFPEEYMEDLNVKNKQLGGEQTKDTEQLPDVYLLPPLHPDESTSSLKKSASESYLGRKTDPTIDQILETSLEESGMSQAMIQRRRHQLRTSFNAAQLSPLMKQYFGSDNKSIKKQCLVLRTTPFQNYPVGVEDAYHKCYNKKTQKLFSLETSKQHDKALKDLQKYQDDAKRAINVLNETRDIVLTSGKKALQAYCAALMNKKHTGQSDGEDLLSSIPLPNNTTGATNANGNASNGSSSTTATNGIFARKV